MGPGGVWRLSCIWPWEPASAARLLLNGRVHHGAHWSGGEFGHILLTTDEAASRKTLEEWASGPGLVQTWRELSGSDAPLTGEQIASEAARDLSGPAARAITRTGECLGFGLAGLANALDPDLIVIGGGLAALGDALLNPARRILSQYALPGPARCPVVPAALGTDAALVGAAALAMEEAPPPQFWGAGFRKGLSSPALQNRGRGPPLPWPSFP